MTAVSRTVTVESFLTPPGNAAKLAGWIQEEDEKADHARPQLLFHIDNMEDYDIVFLGFPNWWYTVPMAVHSFLEEYDLKDR